VEQEDASLRERPFTVQRGGRVVALSDDAGRIGVGRGWSIERLRSLFPRISVVPHDAALVARARRQVLGELYACTPRIEVVGDLIAFEFPRSDASRRALAALVSRWQAHCGAACDRVTAHLAALTVEAGHTRRAAPGREDAFLSRVGVQVLVEAGISPRTVERLQWFGLRRVSDLQPLPARQLRAQFEDGERLARFQRCHAWADLPVKSFVPQASIRARHVFEAAATEPGECLLALDDVVSDACVFLSGRGANSLVLCLETSTGRRTASRLLREPMSSPRSLGDVARVLLCEMFEAGVGEMQVLEVRLENLEGRTAQGELWATRTRRESDLAQVVESLEERAVAPVLRLKARDRHSPLCEERYELVPARPGEGWR
jgi:nucleotidyltransferase/DNA polymerase involved in DNA repair